MLRLRWFGSPEQRPNRLHELWTQIMRNFSWMSLTETELQQTATSSMFFHWEESPTSSPPHLILIRLVNKVPRFCLSMIIVRRKDPIFCFFLVHLPIMVLVPELYKLLPLCLHPLGLFSITFIAIHITWWDNIQNSLKDHISFLQSIEVVFYLHWPKGTEHIAT